MRAARSRVARRRCRSICSATATASRRSVCCRTPASSSAIRSRWARLALRGFAPVDFRQRLGDGLRAAIQIVIAGFLGDLGEDAVDEGVLIAAALAARDDLEGDFDRARQFHNSLIEVQHLRFQSSRKRDDGGPVKTSAVCPLQKLPLAPSSRAIIWSSVRPKLLVVWLPATISRPAFIVPDC